MNTRTNGVISVRRDLVVLAVLGLFAALGPLVGLNTALLSTLAVMFIWMGVNTSWNLVLGMAGVFSFGQVAFFVAGSYTSAILSVHTSVPPWLDVLAALGAGAVLAAAISLPVMRLRGIYVGLVTLALHQFLNAFISTDYSGFTGGPNGLSGIRPFVSTFTLRSQAIDGYWVALISAVLTTLVALLVLRSPVGLAVIAARDGELVAKARGIRVTSYRTLVFVVCGGLAGGLGGVYAHMIGVVSPSLLDFGILMMLLAMIILGGKGTVWGPIVGTAVLTAYFWWIQGSYPDYQILGLGTILVLAVVFLQGGLVGQWRGLERRLRAEWERMA